MLKSISKSIQMIKQLTYSRWSFTLLTLLLILARTVTCHLQFSCPDPEDIAPGPQLPDVPEHFYTAVEANIVNKGYTVLAEEWFDYTRQRAAVSLLQGGGTQRKYIFNFTSEHILHIYKDDLSTWRCTVEQLDGSGGDIQSMFGYNTSAGGHHVFTPGTALHFAAGYQPQYAGRHVDRDRGLTCDVWTLCVAWPELDSVMNVTYHWTVGEVGDDGGYTAPRPARALVSGVAGASDMALRHFEHNYEFMEFVVKSESVAAAETRRYQIPEEVYCPGYPTTREVPDIAKQFSFSSELLVIASDTKVATYQDEWYDYKNKLFRYDYLTIPGLDGPGADLYPNSRVKLTEIHDFNTGISYVTDPSRQNCTARPILQHFGDVNEEIDSSGALIVSMRRPDEFFSFDKGNFVYVGERVERGVTCDVWSGERYDWPDSTSNTTRSVWEWYFTKSRRDNAVQDDINNDTEKPLKLRINAYKQDGTHVASVYNVMNFNWMQVKLDAFAIDTCLLDVEQRRFSVAFDVLGEELSIFLDEFDDIVSDRLHQELVCVSNNNLEPPDTVSPLRFSNIMPNQVNHTSNRLRIEFSIAKPRINITGNLDHEVTEVDIDDIVQTLTNAINTGTFTMAFDMFTMKAYANSLREVTPPVVVESRSHHAQGAKDESQCNCTGVVDEDAGKASTSGGYGSDVVTAASLSALVIGMAVTISIHLGVKRLRSSKYVDSLR